MNSSTVATDGLQALFEHVLPTSAVCWSVKNHASLTEAGYSLDRWSQLLAVRHAVTSRVSRCSNLSTPVSKMSRTWIAAAVGSPVIFPATHGACRCLAPGILRYLRDDSLRWRSIAAIVYELRRVEPAGHLDQIPYPALVAGEL